MKSRILTMLVLISVLGLSACATKPMSDGARANQIVQAAQMTMRKFKTSNEQPMDLFRRMLPKAQGIVILPGVVKGGFILAAEGGSGVMLAKDAAGRWGNPGFYLMAAGSVGLQAGAQMGDAVLLLFSQGAVLAILQNQGKLGADLGLILGTVGAGVEASTTTNVGADVLAFTQGIGAFAGGSLEATALIKRNDLNAAFYGQVLSPTEIVLQGAGKNAAADGLRAVLDAE